MINFHISSKSRTEKKKKITKNFGKEGRKRQLKKKPKKSIKESRIKKNFSQHQKKGKKILKFFFSLKKESENLSEKIYFPLPKKKNSNFPQKFFFSKPEWKKKEKKSFFSSKNVKIFSFQIQREHTKKNH